jgi:hypothetical protein
MTLRFRIENFVQKISVRTAGQILVDIIGHILHRYKYKNNRLISVPDTASYIRGWIQMVLAPNDLFSWNNKYHKYIEYNITDTFTCFFLAMHTTYSVHAGILKPWRGRLPWPLAVSSFYHVLSLSLSGLNWCSLFPPWGSGPPFPKMAPPFTGSAHTPLPGGQASVCALSR